MQERVLPALLIFLSGFLLKRVGILKPKEAEPLVNYVLFFSLPILVFREVRKVQLSHETAGVVLVAWGTILGSLILSFLLGKALGMGERTLRSFLLVSSFGNTAFLGYPFTFALFGEEGLRFAVLYDQIGSFLLVVSVGFYLSRGSFSLKEVLTFPPFPALLLGLFLGDLKFPGFFEGFLKVVGDSLIPVVLFSMGLRFETSHIKGVAGYTLLSLFIKMVLSPLVLLLLLKLLSLDSTGYRVALLETSMPPMVMAGVLAIKYGLDERLALSSIALGVPLSFLTTPLWVSLL